MISCNFHEKLPRVLRDCTALKSSATSAEHGIDNELPFSAEGEAFVIQRPPEKTFRDLLMWFLALLVY